MKIRRLTGTLDTADLSVKPWHNDVQQQIENKKLFEKKPEFNKDKVNRSNMIVMNKQFR